MKNMQNHYVNGIDARSLMAKIPLFMKLCSFLLLINVSVAFASASIICICNQLLLNSL